MPSATGAFWRFALALPVLFGLAVGYERGSLSMRPPLFALLGGFMSGCDMVLWQHAVVDLGAGLATVIGNTQLATIVLIDWLLYANPPTRQRAIGVGLLLVGVVLISGLLSGTTTSAHPVTGTVLGALGGVCGGLVVICMRVANAGAVRPAGALLWLTGTATLTAMAASGVTDHFALGVSLAALAWLAVLALSCQVCGWLMVAIPIRVLSPSTTAIVFIVQPVVALVAARILLNERPGPLQIAGAVIALIGVYVTTRGPKTEQRKRE